MLIPPCVTFDVSHTVPKIIRISAYKPSLSQFEQKQRYIQSSNGSDTVHVTKKPDIYHCICSNLDRLGSYGKEARHTVYRCICSNLGRFGSYACEDSDYIWERGRVRSDGWQPAREKGRRGDGGDWGGRGGGGRGGWTPFKGNR